LAERHICHHNELKAGIARRIGEIEKQQQDGTHDEDRKEGRVQLNAAKRMRNIWKSKHKLETQSSYSPLFEAEPEIQTNGARQCP
jgi:hypothetical protein